MRVENTKDRVVRLEGSICGHDDSLFNQMGVGQMDCNLVTQPITGLHGGFGWEKISLGIKMIDGLWL